ncbi:MAG: hypothetical protein CL607_06060 [Anaerolineaceae bacterium]|nr:hypothetical protein [Anaerolineaceae bacterium]
MRGRREWTKGVHESIISEQLFNEVQDARAKNARAKKNPRITRNALLSGIVFCARCLSEKPLGLSDDSYGKLYTHVLRQKWHYYECSARRRGYGACGQLQIRQETIDEQVISALHDLHRRLPEDVTERIDGIMRRHREHAKAMQHIDDIRKVVERVEISWENEFMDEDTYVQKRRQLQIDMEMLRPLEQDDLLRSASLLNQFDKLWEECKNTEDQQALIRQILDKVIVFDNEVIALVLKGDTALLIDSNKAVSDSGEGGTRTLTSEET